LVIQIIKAKEDKNRRMCVLGKSNDSPNNGKKKTGTKKIVRYINVLIILS
jgi:hypothetical protein